MTQKARIGTVSHGTLRSEDLIPAFRDELERLADMTSWPLLNLADECQAIIEAYDEGEEVENASEIVNELIDELNQYAPLYCYFGAHEGDGSDFGFWPDWGAIELGIEFGEILKVSDLSEVPNDYQGEVAVVNDHGNLTLYSVWPEPQFEELWAIV